MNAERSGRPTSRDVLDRSGGAPPAPASNRRILPNRERCLLDTHVAPPHTCVLSPPASSPGPAGTAPTRRPACAHTPPGQRIKKWAPDVVRLLRRLYARGRPGAGGGRRAEKTHARATQGYTCDQLATADLFRTHAEDRHEGATRRRPARRRHKNYSNDEDMHISSSFDIRGAHGSASHRAQSLSGRAARLYAAAPSWPSSLQVTPSPPPSPPPFSPRGSGEG